ncbi:hypothetical protein LVJ85_06805 [Neisseria sp. Dent CA1/247]|uniref:hypothetical protein n=1 Tax=Neisseria sp. Dent CA1/247 TaxID=2912675 RepID=UPI001FD19B8F|nr:hypothetical protein [Neisseria sp. Dent CA1/247]UOO78162.1 hypothetical protein LVJ85_06805 [Neisseria sp. Dent CA1/247]
MNKMLIIITVFLIIIFFILVYFIIKKQKINQKGILHKNSDENINNSVANSIRYQNTLSTNVTTQIFEESKEEDLDAIIVDNSGIQLISICQSNKPFQDIKEPDKNIQQHFKHLTSDIFKGIVSVPNKTLEVTFHPEIIKGLENGSYKLMRTKNGEVLADAIDISSKNIVGKGRLVEGNKLKQIAGAGFQLISIAVAQSHLDDIEKSLKSIETLCNDIKNNQESEKLSKIKGRISYLENFLSGVKVFKDPYNPYHLSSEKSTKLEDTIQDIYEFQEQLTVDLKNLISKIEKQKDKDWFGSGNTHKELKITILDINRITIRRKLIIKLYCLLKLLTAYIDPYNKKYSSFENIFSNEDWNSSVVKFNNSVENKVYELFQNKVFNLNDTLESRRNEVLSISNKFSDSIKLSEQECEMLMLSLNNSLKIANSEKELKYALTFDEKGKVENAILLN